MTFDELLVQVRELVRSKGRVSYRALKLQFNLDDDYLEGLKDELIEAERIAADEGGRVLVWVGAAPGPSSEFRVPSPLQPPTPNTQPLTPNPQPLAERRQLTVMFCDLVNYTALSTRLDPEELQEVVRTYQDTCTDVIRRYEGHIAQHLGDGLLVYFGYPLAHEDDAQRAVRAGLEIVAALQNAEGSNPRLPLEQHDVLGSAAERRVMVDRSFKAGLHVRIGIHTGLVVIGEIGSSEKREILALGETPNLAARIQGQAAPDEVMISAATYRLVEGLFGCEDRGQPALKGVAIPFTLYRVVTEEEAQSRFQVVARRGLTPLVGRDHEYGLLRERWERVKDGAGQAILLSGEPGIGKSRLVQALKERVHAEGSTCIEFHCSPYHQNSAFHPIIEHLQRLLGFQSENSPEEKLRKLEVGARRDVPLQRDTLPLLASLLSLPQPDGTPPLTLSPQKQKQKTQEALVAWLVEEAERQPVYCVWEDLHWADPSSLEVLGLLLEQTPTTRLLAVLTFRPEFVSPWGRRSHLSQMTLSRLGPRQVREMVSHVAAQAVRASTGSARTGDISPSDSDSVRPELVEGRVTLSDDLIDTVIARTDGVPLFVEELTKTVIESIGSVESVGSHPRPFLQSLAIPATLQDSLMARLDRLGSAKAVAQLGATIGREFSYELLHTLSPVDEATLQQELRQLVEAELLYQRGLPPQATYLFKHALVQDAAYQSLLKSTRKQYHQQIAQMLEERFTETKETQPELVAHHYTEAGLSAQAIPYWQRAGERASQRSAHVEAIAHLTKGLELPQLLPDTPERTHQELRLQLALGGPLMATKGYAAPEVESVYTRALELCRQLGETPRLFWALLGLYAFYLVRAELKTARELAEQCLTLAQNVHNPIFLVWAHFILGNTLFWLGEFALAREHLEEGIALYDPQQHRSYSTSTVEDPGVTRLCYAAWTLWFLGYPDQALQRSHEALTLAQELSHPYSLAYALHYAAMLHQLRREGQAAQEWAERTIAVATDQGFPHWLAWGTISRGWALAEQGQVKEGITQIRQGMAALRTIGAETGRPIILALLAEAYGKAGQVEEGLTVLTEALALVDKNGERYYEAELYRLKGELTLQQWKVESQKSKVKEQEAGECFLKAIEIAKKQQAKSLELRASMSLAQLWQTQGKPHEARNMLSEIYGWFTEGFDTKDLQEAKTLLEELSHWAIA